MNKIAFFLCILSSAAALAQDSQTSKLNPTSGQSENHLIPAVDIKTMSGENISTSVFDNGGKPIIIDFWATWCKPCVEELNAINDVYADWKKNTGVKVIVISLDDSRTLQRVAPFVNGKGWTYESYIDPNGDFKRAMSVNMPPHTFVINGKKEIVWQHVGFAEGNEDEIYDAVKKISNK